MESVSAVRHYGALCAEFYDLTKPVGGRYPDVPYYLRRLSTITHAVSPTRSAGRILEAAVGTGRLLIPLLQAGLQVDGIDSSSEMLAYCRRNCAAAGMEPTLYCGALQTMALPESYGAIVISFGSLMLLSAPGEAETALDRMKHHLAPRGRLFLDVDAPGTRARRPDNGESSRSVRCVDGSTIVLRDTPVGYDAAARVERRLLTYEKSKDGRIFATEVQDFHLRHYDDEEMQALLTSAGFVNVEACADYTEGAAVATAREWLCFSARLAA